MIRLRQPAALGLGPAFGAGLGFLVGLVLIVALGDKEFTTNGVWGREWAAFVGIRLRLLLAGATTLIGGLLGLIVGTILAPPPYNAIGALLLLSLAGVGWGWWALHAPQRRDQAFLNAVYRGKHDEIERMLGEGFPINRSIHGLSPLLWALEWHKPDEARFLVQKGASVNVVNPGRGSALCLAVHSGDVDLVREMLRRGADPYLADHERNVPELLSHSATWPAGEMRALLERSIAAGTVRQPIAR